MVGVGGSSVTPLVCTIFGTRFSFSPSWLMWCLLLTLAQPPVMPTFAAGGVSASKRYQSIHYLHGPVVWLDKPPAVTCYSCIYT